MSNTVKIIPPDRAAIINSWVLQTKKTEKPLSWTKAKKIYSEIAEYIETQSRNEPEAASLIEKA